ncbi:Imm72 family immunity protein [Aquabacterium sp.]|uniref:Imm72 family immunity protein n=1 Tax=Aquabacterium sp. TaxID=1872578 RepID=UPI0035AFB1E4
MAMLHFLKPKWSAVKITEEDRARQFWLRKRRTSYTAWKRCRDAYAVYVELIERQCKEEPIGQMGAIALAKEVAGVEKLISEGVLPKHAINGIERSYQTEWTSSVYATALRGLSLYDKGLALLKQGDRSVFQHNSRGFLEDAYHYADHEYQMYVLGGRNGGDGMVYYGKYVAAIKASLVWASEVAGFAAGGLQDKMANLSAGVIWEDTREVYDPKEKRRKRILGSSDQWQRDTIHLKELPRVPSPVADVLVRTGESCPVFGIYEAQVKDGLMVYMCAGEGAYRYGEPRAYSGGGQPITWRLIWEDQRYVDGVMPPEEADYYPETLTPPDFSHFVGEDLENDWNSNQLLVAHTGEPAPLTGRWAARDDLRGTVYWRKGDPLPHNQGQDVDWVYSGA